MARFYEVADDTITIYKHRVYGPVQIVFATILTPVLVYLLVNDFPAHYKIGILAGTAVLTVMLLAYLQFEKIVFDLGAKTVYRQLPLLGKLHIASFNEIAGIDFVGINRGILSPLVKHSSYCRMVLKNDRLGKGIKILSQIKNNRDELIPFNMDVVQRLNLIFNQVPPPEEKPATIFSTNSSTSNAFMYLKEGRSGIYTIGISAWKWGRIVFWTGLLFLMYEAFVQGGSMKDYIDAIIYIGFPLLFAFCIYSDSRTVSFDTNNRIIEVSHVGGIVKKRYDFSGFSNFHLVRNTLNMIYTGTDLYIIMQDNSNIQVINMYNTRKLEVLAGEIKSLFGYQ
jgi:hypothetical protein